MKLIETKRSSKYVDFKVIKKQPEVLTQMSANRIRIKLHGDIESYHRDQVYTYVEEVVDFCETNNQGIWTYEYTSTWLDEEGFLIKDEDDSDAVLCEAIIKFYFEFQEDADKFHNNFLVLYKLSN
jgi:hypothetical protein